MTEPEHTDDRPELSKTAFVAALLEVGGVLLLLSALGWAIYTWVTISQQDQPSAADFVTSIPLLMAGVGGWLLLWGVAVVIRKLDALPDILVQQVSLTPSAAAPAAAATSAPASVEAEASDEIVTLLREVRDISLLNDEQRAQRLDAQGKEAVRRIEHEVPALLREHSWLEARRLVQEARERFPSFSEWDALEQQIEKVRAEVEARDVEAATRQVNDLAALGAWPRAMDVANDLLHRHPDSARARDLAKRARFEREKVEAEQRAKLMALAQEASNRHNWSASLQAANTILQRFPRSPEAAALQLQIPTLRENVEIETRRNMEAQIRDLIKQQRYAEALRIARELMHQYPNSPQAEALRGQLPRLEERAAARR